jgi:hypothetical protein
VHDNAEDLNKDLNAMNITTDNNTTHHVFGRLYRRIFAPQNEIIPAQHEEDFQKLPKSRRMSKLTKDHLESKKRQSKLSAFETVLVFLCDFIFNVIYFLCLALQKTVFNYLGGFLVIIIQMAGYYFTTL